MGLRNLASMFALLGLLMLGCDNNATNTRGTPSTQPLITPPPVTDPDPAMRGGAGSGNFADPGLASPITTPGGATTIYP